jgi:lipopolysaccharide biosynthesis glycosyltransferase
MPPSEVAIRVITLADDAYAMPLAVMVRSLIENHSPGRALRITVIDGGISAGNRRRLDASWTSGLPPKDVEWTFVPPSFGNAEVLPIWGRMARLTYARLALNDYFNTEDGRVVLLDSDTMVLTDLAPLHDLDLGAAAIGATKDPYIPTVSAINGLATWRESGLPPDAPYFCAGIMVVDLQRWRQQGVTRRAVDYIRREQHRLRIYDQDALNAVLGRDWIELDERWQAHPRLLRSVGRRPPAEPWIVHFSGRLKPWLYDARGRADALYYEYLDRTAWRGFRPPRDFASLALKLYDSPLRRVLYPLEIRLLALKRLIDQRA